VRVLRSARIGRTLWRVRSRSSRWTATASIALALACTSCGGAAPPTAKPLAMSVAREQCPPRSFGPGALAYYPPGVLVPGDPTSVLICRYGSLQDIGLPGDLAGALSVSRSAVTSHLASDFDSLPFRRPRGNCPEVGERSEREHRTSPAPDDEMRPRDKRLGLARRTRPAFFVATGDPLGR
jgi:hypothetical protein